MYPAASLSQHLQESSLDNQPIVDLGEPPKLSYFLIPIDGKIEFAGFIKSAILQVPLGSDLSLDTLVACRLVLTAKGNAVAAPFSRKSGYPVS